MAPHFLDNVLGAQHELHNILDRSDPLAVIEVYSVVGGNDDILDRQAASFRDPGNDLHGAKREDLGPNGTDVSEKLLDGRFAYTLDC